MRVAGFSILRAWLAIYNIFQPLTQLLVVFANWFWACAEIYSYDKKKWRTILEIHALSDLKSYINFNGLIYPIKKKSSWRCLGRVSCRFSVSLRAGSRWDTSAHAVATSSSLLARLTQRWDCTQAYLVRERNSFVPVILLHSSLKHVHEWNALKNIEGVNC